jgi:hypothetical protein
MKEGMEHPMQKLNDLSRSLAPLEPDGTLIAVIEMSQSSWLVAGIVPGVERQPLKKLAADDRSGSFDDLVGKIEFGRLLDRPGSPRAESCQQSRRRAATGPGSLLHRTPDLPLRCIPAHHASSAIANEGPLLCPRNASTVPRTSKLCSFRALAF